MLRKITKATVVMDSGKELNFDEDSTQSLVEMLKNEVDMTKQKPIVINNEKGITMSIIYPQHIAHIHFE
jgi:hypothetical protein